MTFLRRFRPGLALLLGAALVALAACGGGTQDVTVLTCPQVYIVKDANTFVAYAAGSGRDIIDKRFEAKITNVEWLCTFLTEQNRVDMEVRFAMRAELGPVAVNAGTRQVRFPYFVAVADPDGKIIAKQVFGIDIAFPGNVLEVGHVESVLQRLTYGSLAQAARYTVYIGFQLSHEQLAEVRAGTDL